MTKELGESKAIFDKYHRFDDGLIKSMEITYGRDGSVEASFVFYARDHSAASDVWRNVKVRVRKVTEVSLSAQGNQITSICSGVRLLNFDGLWCVEVDGTYAYDKDPTTIDEIRKHGTCYAFGREVEALEIDERPQD